MQLINAFGISVKVICIYVNINQLVQNNQDARNWYLLYICRSNQ